MEQQGADRDSKKQRREKLSNMYKITAIIAKFEHVNFELSSVNRNNMRWIRPMQYRPNETRFRRLNGK
jgi:hypothetical protein